MSEEKPANTRFLAWLSLIVVAFGLFMPLSAGGIWDPPEREVAELARRIGLNLLGGHALAVDGADNLVPTRSELGRGELPFTSVALGFRVFGLHEWAGRLPLACWGVLGLAAMCWLVWRLSDARAAWFSVLILATMPLYFVQARTMLGDIVTMAALAFAFAGFGVALFDRRASEPTRWLALGLGVLGVLCGLLSRGVLIGVAAPLVAVGAVWLVLRAARLNEPERLGDALGALALLVGVGLGAWAGRALLVAPESAQQFSLWLGSAVNRPHVLPTFDSVLLQLGHALFPWSALLPVALGSLLREPPLAVAAEAERQREVALRALCLAFPVVVLLAASLAAPVLGLMPFSAVAPLAVCIALFVRDFERGSGASRVPPMLICAFGILLLSDFKNFPDKGLSAFVVNDVHFPEGLKSLAERLLMGGTLLSCAACFFLLQERSTTRDSRFSAAEYKAWPRVFRELWAGNLQFVVLVLEAALIGLCVLGYLSDHVPAFRKLDALTAAPRGAAAACAVLVPLAVLSPALALGVRDSFRTLFDPELGTLFGNGRLSRWLAGGLSRAQAALLGFVGFGLVLSLWYYPVLAVQLSPKQVFEIYRREARASEPLAMLGSGAASASYYAGRNVPSFDSSQRAFDWLTATTERRFLAIRDTDLSTLNALFRARERPARNLPVLGADFGEILLVSNRLGGAPNQSPLLRYLPDVAPHPAHVLDANLGDKLDVLGWDTLDADGRPAPTVTPGRRYQLVIYYRVVQPITGNWDTFVHIDGFQRRFNGDHPTLAGKYPFNLWRVGDFVADSSELALEPNFGAGKYRVYFGLYNGSRRLEVRRGRAEENRLEAGFLDVR